jgi:hypothetical protein
MNTVHPVQWEELVWRENDGCKTNCDILDYRFNVSDGSSCVYVSLYVLLCTACYCTCVTAYVLLCIQ